MSRPSKTHPPAKGHESSFSHLQNNTNPTWWRDRCLRKNVLHCIALYFNIFYLGYDGSLLNGLQELTQWTSYFNHPESSRLGVISACLFLPAIVTPYVGDLINHRYGRKACLAVSSLLLIAGAFINSFATSDGMFMGGRVIIGAAGGMGKITAAALLQEIAHPRLRPVLATSLYCNYYVGAAAAAWWCFGTLHWADTEWAWRAPCLFQIMAPTVILLSLIIIPESPRWLVDHGKNEEALHILAKYHANGDHNDELVKHEYHEIGIAIREEARNKQTRYVDFLKTPGNRRRLLVTITMATGGNWVGNGVITYYLTPILNLVGVANNRDISAINGGLAIWNLLLAYFGSLNAERLGRRKLWLISTSGMLASYIVITGLSAGFAQTNDSPVGLAVIPMLFIFFAFYDFGWTPLPYSYGAEIMPYHLRVKGLGIQLSVQSIAQAFNQWVNPVALHSIVWKYYVVYIAMDAMYLLIVIFYFPETKGLTIEEVGVLFDTGRLGDTKAATGGFEAQRRRADQNPAETPGVERGSMEGDARKPEEERIEVV